MKKRILIWSAISVFIILLGTFIYFLFYQNMPEFAISTLKQLAQPTSPDRILVLAPHPDDEVLGVGGYMATAIKNNATVKVVIATNGDGERFSASSGFRKIQTKPKDYIAIGYARQKESVAALKVLGLSENNIVFLGYPDGGLKSMLVQNWTKPYRSPHTKVDSSPYNNSFSPNTVFTGENLNQDLTKIINDYQPNIIFCTSSDDAHPDHAALAGFLAKIKNNSAVSTNYYLIHARRFPYPKGIQIKRYLTPPLRLITFSNVWSQFDLPVEVETLKENAIAQYKSQLKEPFLKSLMLGFVKKDEIFSTE